MRVSAHAVCTAIRDDIVVGALPPGARLTEEFLARRYGVSRVPVREALRTLEAEGFVHTRRHAGARVAEPTAREAADLLELRALLEPLGAARAAQRRTEAHLKVLRGVVRLGRQRVAAGQLGDLRVLGEWFHGTVAQASGSTSMTALLTQLRRKIAWVYAVEVPGQPLARAVADWEEFAAIAEAVTRGDAERARMLTGRQVERSAVLHRLRHPPAPPPVVPERRVAAQPGRKLGVRKAKHSVNTAHDQN